MGKTTQHLLKQFYMAGSQMWFTPKGRLDKKLRGFGCGVVALHDLNVYKGYLKAPEGRNEYMEQIRKMEKGGVFVFPGLGIAPYYYPLLCNFYLFTHGSKMRVGWGHTARSQLRNGARDIKRCLDNDCPVIFAAGPGYPFLFRDKFVTLYNRDRKPSGKRTREHYMTVLGTAEADGEIWLEVASWGEQFSIRLDELVKYSKYAMPFSTRFYNIYEKK